MRKGLVAFVLVGLLLISSGCNKTLTEEEFSRLVQCDNAVKEIRKSWLAEREALIEAIKNKQVVLDELNDKYKIKISDYSVNLVTRKLILTKQKEVKKSPPATQ